MMTDYTQLEDDALKETILMLSDKLSAAQERLKRKEEDVAEATRIRNEEADELGRALTESRARREAGQVMEPTPENLELAAQWMHEWSQLDQGKARPWGEDGCVLCRGRVRILMNVLKGTESETP